VTLCTETEASSNISAINFSHDILTVALHAENAISKVKKSKYEIPTVLRDLPEDVFIKVCYDDSELSASASRADPSPASNLNE